MLKLLFIPLFFFLLQAPDTSPEEGKPPSCDNYKDTAPNKRCQCGRAMQKCDGMLPEPPADVRMDARCKTYCREQNCQCAGMRCRS